MRIIILVETFNREFFSKLSLTFSILKNNEIIFGSTYELINDITYFKPDIVFLNNADYNNNLETSLKILSNNGAIIILLENEGGVFHDINVQKNRLNIRITKYIDYYFSWGMLMSKFVIENNIFNKNQVYITGHPYFDLLHKKFTKIYTNEVNTLKIKFGNFVLINTRFSVGNEYIQDQYINFENPDRYIFEKKLVDFFINLTIFLSLKLKDIKIVLRPHPSEDIITYQNALSNIENVYVVREGSVQPWIIASQALIHNGCTTAIEALLLNKKIISYMPIKNDLFDFDLPNKISLIANNKDQVYDYIVNDITNPLKNHIVSDVINNFNSVSLFQIRKVIKIISQTNKNKTNIYIENLDLIKLYLKSKILKLKHSNFYNFFLFFLPSNYRKEFEYQNSKFKKLDKLELEECLKANFNQKNIVVNNLYHNKYFKYKKSYRITLNEK
jgi:surface carbohydrate biosynthesis protein